MAGDQNREGGPKKGVATSGFNKGLYKDTPPSLQPEGTYNWALNAINEVRQRADMPALASITMQDIEDERVKELSIERTRYFDILRWGKVVEKIVNRPELKSESSGTSSYKPGREYIDIPQNEIDANPNFKHNPGY